jgi:hypothetical protein
MGDAPRLKISGEFLREKLTAPIGSELLHLGAELTLSPGDEAPNPLSSLRLLPKEVDPRIPRKVISKSQDIPVPTNNRRSLHRATEVHMDEIKRGGRPTG